LAPKPPPPANPATGTHGTKYFVLDTSVGSASFSPELVERSGVVALDIALSLPFLEVLLHFRLADEMQRAAVQNEVRSLVARDCLCRLAGTRRDALVCEALANEVDAEGAVLVHPSPLAQGLAVRPPRVALGLGPVHPLDPLDETCNALLYAAPSPRIGLVAIRAAASEQGHERERKQGTGHIAYIARATIAPWPRARR
jgi:hypothetical protein